MPALLTMREVAKALGLRERAARQRMLACRDLVTVYRIGREYRVDAKSFEQWIKSHRI